MTPPIRTAVVLAAGMGTRMKQKGTQMPKGFLCLGQHPIIEESLWHLQAVGIRRVVIVTGHLAHFYDRLAEKYPQLVQTVHNPRFADSGSMASLSCAAGRVAEGFLLLESDLTYQRRALTECLGFAGDNVVLVSGFTNSGDEVFVEARRGRLVAMSKNRKHLGPDIVGEFVGISKISSKLYRTMLRDAAGRFRTSYHVDYETGCLAAVARRIPVHCHLVEDLRWYEIDDEWQLRRAKQARALGHVGPHAEPHPTDRSMAAGERVWH